MNPKNLDDREMTPENKKYMGELFNKETSFESYQTRDNDSSRNGVPAFIFAIIFSFVPDLTTPPHHFRHQARARPMAAVTDAPKSSIAPARRSSRIDHVPSNSFRVLE
jgi:hypothetical protein